MIYLSNFLEKLADLSLSHLYHSKSNPFTRRIVVIPDFAIKDILMRKMAENPHFQIAAGMEFLTLAQLLSLPSSLELSLFLETEILQNLEEKRFEPLKAYLGEDKRRLPSLCDRLATLFLQYRNGLWAKGSGWQETLWKATLERWPFSSIEVPNLHFLGFSFLPEPLIDFFEKKGANFYFFSPCQIFWEDYYSEKERLKIHVEAAADQRKSFEATFQGQNSLLSAWGKVGRKTQQILSDRQFEEHYMEFTGATYLSQLQSHILNGEEMEEREGDHSLKMFSTSTCWDEVELLKKKLSILLQQGIEPCDIQVFAPNIAAYAPYICTVFEEGQIEISIEDLPLEQIDPLFQAFRKLIELPDKEFERTVVLEFISFPHVMEKWGLTEGNVRQIEKWCKETHIRDWDEGLSILVRGLAEPGGVIEQSELELFDILYRLVTGLKEDKLDPRPISEWADYFSALLERYFVFDRDADVARHLKRLSAAFRENKIFLPYKSARRMVLRYMQRPAGHLQPPHLQAIHFSSLPHGVIWPKRVICLLGMHEEAFPRKSMHDSLDIFETPFHPDMGELDRYLFLQCMLSAREALYISYPREHPGEIEEIAPALALEQLGLPIERISLKREKRKPINKVLSADIELPSTIDVKKLSKLAKNPEKFFFQESLRIYGEEEENDFDEFIISPLKKYLLCKEALKVPLDHLLAHEERWGKLPKHLFKEVAIRKISDDYEEQLNHLHELGVTPDEVFSLRLSPTCKEREKLPNGDWVFPPLVITLESGQEIQLVGTIDEVTPKGLLVRSEGAFVDQIKSWPQYLIYQLLMPEGEKAFLFLKKGKSRSLEVKDPTSALKNFLNYYCTALKHPSPLQPEIVEALLLNKPTDIAATWEPWAKTLYLPLTRGADGCA